VNPELDSIFPLLVNHLAQFCRDLGLVLAAWQGFSPSSPRKQGWRQLCMVTVSWVPVFAGTTDKEDAAPCPKQPLNIAALIHCASSPEVQKTPILASQKSQKIQRKCSPSLWITRLCGGRIAPTCGKPEDGQKPVQNGNNNVIPHLLHC
jgi:hypothetical protein